MTALDALADNARQAETISEQQMTFDKTQGNRDVARSSQHIGFFRFSFFSFSTAAIAEGAGD